jgi:hypothetical protein
MAGRQQSHAVPDHVACYVMAATIGKKAGDIPDRLIGDGLVPLDSALGRDDDPALNLFFPPERQWIGYGMNHLALLHRLSVYHQLLDWLQADEVAEVIEPYRLAGKSVRTTTPK